ncbi:MAG: hypothetical protein AAF696_04225 [Bacteroidota bacterium]
MKYSAINYLLFFFLLNISFIPDIFLTDAVLDSTLIQLKRHIRYGSEHMNTSTIANISSKSLPDGTYYFYSSYKTGEF